MRQTDAPIGKLIEMCEAQMQGTGECHSCHGPMPVCFFINEIGCVALEENDRMAQKYLIGLLSHSNMEWRFFAFCYLLQISKDALEAGDAVILQMHEKKSENIALVKEALKEVCQLN